MPMPDPPDAPGADDGSWPPPDPEAWEEPHDTLAEQWLLACLMQGGEKALDLAIDAGLCADDWYRPAHEQIGGAITAMAGAGEPIDPLTLRGWMGEAAFPAGGRFTPVYLFDLWQIAANWMQAGHYAAIVHGTAVLRRQVRAGRRLVQGALAAGADPVTVQARAETDLAAATGASGRVGGELVTTAELAARIVDSRHRWVVPGMLAEEDKLILVAPEGSGKSLIGAQVVLCAGAGVHPLLPGAARFAPVRGLIVDLELSPSMLVRRADLLLPYTVRDGLDQDMVKWWHRPEGIDLRTADGQAQFTEAVRRQRPQIIAAGPMYKMGIAHGQAQDDDTLVVAQFLDRIKTKYHCALWLEQHAPMRQGPRARDLRPIGTVLWQQWPDFGWSLTPAPKQGLDHYRWSHYRLPRERRTWPEFVHWRPAYEPGWPWAATYEAGAFDEPLEDFADITQPIHEAVPPPGAPHNGHDDLAGRRSGTADN
jgi:replicative DNA helicase